MNKICVLGLGYIGLPTASILATRGYKVLGVDIDADLISKLQKGEMRLDEPDLDTIVKAALNSKNLTLSLKPAEADVFIITVPTPVKKDKKSDLSCVVSAGRSIVPYIRTGCLVILESTVPPGTTTDLLMPVLQESGLKAGQDFSLAFSPERVLPGQLVYELIENDRIVGGIDKRSSELAKEIYQSFVKGRIYITAAKTAEMIKLMENTFRDVNIALANEFAMIAEELKIDVWEAIEIANMHPRVNILRPGPGVGGHCIAVDPWFIVEKAPKYANLIKLAREINDQMPHYVTNLILEGLSKHIPSVDNLKISVFGLTYKGDVNDIRESPAINIIDELINREYKINIYDPYVKSYPPYNNLIKNLDECVEGADCLIFLTDHKIFKELDPNMIGNLMRNNILIDTRCFLDHSRWQEHGFNVLILGKNLKYAKPENSN